MNTKVGRGTIGMEYNPTRRIKQIKKVVFSENYKQLTLTTA